jgi:uncharacterized BrkB/YihY/UPF0761 family membrane protein
MTRLFSAGLILAAVVLLMLSLFAQVVIGAAQEVIIAVFPQLAGLIAKLSGARVVPALGLALSLYVLFATLTPPQHRKSGAPRWPGALFTTSSKPVTSFKPAASSISTAEAFISLRIAYSLAFHSQLKVTVG